MKLSVSLILLAVITTGCAGTELKSTALSSEVASQYVFWNGVVGHDEPVIQTDVTATFANGISVGVWHSAGLNDGDLNSDFGDEVDLAVGRSGKAGDYDLVYGLSYFDIFELGEGEEGAIDVWHPFVVVSQEYDVASAHSLTPSLKLETRSRVHGDSNLGVSLTLGLDHAYAFPESDFSVVHGPRIMADSVSIGFDEVILGRYDAKLLYQVSERFTWGVVRVTGMTPLTDTDNRQESEFVLSTGFSYAF